MNSNKIKIEFDKTSNEVIIISNADGLRHLADICLRIINKEGPAAHWHLSTEMNNLAKMDEYKAHNSLYFIILIH